MTGSMEGALPLVSVITPAYNRASYLDETIQSVLSQDYPRIEYIVLDDGSTDKTREVLAKYTGRITWETHPNMGETRTVNKGFSMAKGETVVVVNSDDPLLPGAVSEAVAFMQAHPDVLVAYPDWNYIGPNSEVMSHMQVREYDYLHMLKRHYCTPGPGAFIRRRAFELTHGRDPEFRYVADYEYWVRLGLYGRFARIPGTLATFRVHPDSASISHRGKAMADEHLRLMRKFYARPDLSPGVLAARREAFAWAYFTAAMTYGHPGWTPLRHCVRGMLYHPLSFFAGLGRVETWAIVLSMMLPRPLFKMLQWGWHRVRRDQT